MSDTPGPGDYQPDPAEPSGAPEPSAAPGDPAAPADPHGWASPSDQGTPFGEQPGYGQGIPYGQPWAPAASYPPPADDAAPVIMSFAPASKQNRLTVLFRGIIAIPAVFVLFFVVIAAYLVGFVGWWAALLTGKLPDGMFKFLSGALRWIARVQAYNALLTDRYPPFSLDDDPDYPIRLLTRPTRLNRVAVFFRVILQFPAYFVTLIASFGLLILGFFGWLITLFAGKLPDSLHQTFAAIIRYYIRLVGYNFLVTPAYPGGLYGDRATATAATAATEWTVPADSAFGEGAPVTPAGATPTPANPWQLVLSGSARTLMTVSLVAGFLGYAAESTYTAIAVSKGTGSRVVADHNVTDDYNKLGTVITSFQTKTQDCQQNISCVTALDGQVAKAFQTFGNGLADAGVPSDFSSDAATLTADNTKVVGDFNQLSTAQSAGQYTNIATGLNLQGDLTAWQSAFNKLHGELGRP